MKFMFACGGTGGHINPAIAVADRLKELFPDAAFLFVGGKDNSMEMELVPKAGYKIEGITASNLRRGMRPGDIAHNIRATERTARALGQSRRIIKEFKPNAVIGTGGYVCYPVLRAAAKMGIPTVVHESNVLPGLTTRMLEKHVDRILVGFEAGKANFKNNNKAHFTGTPVRNEFRQWDKDVAKSHLGVENSFFVLSFWGSLGALYMNQKTAELININEKEGRFKHMHSTGGGEKGLMAMREMLGLDDDEQLRHTQLFSYIYDIPMIMAAADLVLCRAGGSTLNELAALGKPAILIPSPYVTGNHQEINARVLQSGGAAIMIREKECNARMLFDAICEISENKSRLQDMSAAMKALDRPDATDRIVDTILSLIGERNPNLR